MANLTSIIRGTKEKYLAQTTIDSNALYALSNMPEYSISNADMSLAVTTQQDLFEAGEIFICSDSGNYLKGHIYQLNDSKTAWSDITPTVQPLYKHELVIPYSFSVTEPANETATVNGSVIYNYLSNSGTQITSASAIDDNFMLSGGIGKNSANTVLLFDVNVTKAGSSITVEAVNAATNGYITGTVGTITDIVTQLI